MTSDVCAPGGTFVKADSKPQATCFHPCSFLGAFLFLQTQSFRAVTGHVNAVQRDVLGQRPRYRGVKVGGKHADYQRRLLTLLFLPLFLLLDDTKLNQYAGSEGKPLIFPSPARRRSE